MNTRPTNAALVAHYNEMQDEMIADLVSARGCGDTEQARELANEIQSLDVRITELIAQILAGAE